GTTARALISKPKRPDEVRSGALLVGCKSPFARFGLPWKTLLLARELVPARIVGAVGRYEGALRAESSGGLGLAAEGDLDVDRLVAIHHGIDSIVTSDAELDPARCRGGAVVEDDLDDAVCGSRGRIGEGPRLVGIRQLPAACTGAVVGTARHPDVD